MTILVAAIGGGVLAAVWLGLLALDVQWLVEGRMGPAIALLLVRWALVVGTFVAIARTGGGAALLAALVGFAVVRTLGVVRGGLHD
ncbi:MAG: hypothetical protein R3F59_10925 [Myxococcota bacterium]